MVCTTDYKGYLLFVFENGRVAKVPLSAYATKTKRKKLINAYCEKFKLHTIVHIEQDTDIIMRSTNGRILLLNSGALTAKTTKNNGGVAVMTQKKGQRVFSAAVYNEGELVTPHRHRARNLPAAGSMPSADEQKAEQLSI